MTIDEELYRTKFANYIREIKPEFDEVKVQRVTQLAIDVVKIMDVSAYNKAEQKHDWVEQEWIFDRLTEYNRIQPADTDIDLIWAVGIPTNLKRLTCKEYPKKGGTPVYKFVLNKYFKMSDLDRQPEPDINPAPKKSQYENPFE